MFSQAKTISLTFPQNFKHGILSTKLKYKFLFSTLLFLLFIWAFSNSLKCGNIGMNTVWEIWLSLEYVNKQHLGLSMHTRILSFPVHPETKQYWLLFVSKVLTSPFFLSFLIAYPLWQNTRHLYVFFGELFSYLKFFLPSLRDWI